MPSVKDIYVAAFCVEPGSALYREDSVLEIKNSTADQWNWIYAGINSFILETYIAPLQETTSQRRSQPSRSQSRKTSERCIIWKGRPSTRNAVSVTFWWQHLSSDCLIAVPDCLYVVFSFFVLVDTREEWSTACSANPRWNHWRQWGILETTILFVVRTEKFRRILWNIYPFYQCFSVKKIGTGT